MYFDDLTVQDWAKAAAGSQQAIEDLADAMGYPFAEAKRQRPSTQGDFLGLIHDLAACHTAAEIRLWIRDRLETKVRGYITDSLTTAKLAPGTAAKLYSCLTFLDQHMFGKVSRAGLSCIHERQLAPKETHLPRAAQSPDDHPAHPRPQANTPSAPRQPASAAAHRRLRRSPTSAP